MDTKTIKDLIKTIIPDNLMIHRLPQKASNSILFTFDDGPDEQITPLILERLKTYGVKALFFVIGEKVEKFPHILKMIVEDGHIVGNHTQTHPYQKIPAFKEYKENIEHCQDTINKTIDTAPKYYRPPAGTLSISGLLLARRLGLKTVLWSIEGGEWGIHKEDSALEISHRLKKNLQPRDIVLLHDDNMKVPTILDESLPVLKERKIDLVNGVQSL